MVKNDRKYRKQRNMGRQSVKKGAVQIGSSFYRTFNSLNLERFFQMFLPALKDLQ